MLYKSKQAFPFPFPFPKPSEKLIFMKEQGIADF